MKHKKGKGGPKAHKKSGKKNRGGSKSPNPPGGSKQSKPPGGRCPTMRSVGLRSANNLNCGPKPNRKDIVLRPSDNVRARVEKARPGAFIYFSPGTYSNGVDFVEVPTQATLWAEPGTVTLDGRMRMHTAFMSRMTVKSNRVRIFGIRFINFKPRDFEGVIHAPTNGVGDPFNARSDPKWGYNPSNSWTIDCCVFERWISNSGESMGNAITCGSGMTIQGCQFKDGEGLSISCRARDVTITGNRFTGVQMRKVVNPSHCGVIKMGQSKRAKIMNNYFKDIGCRVIWFDTNHEEGYVGYNEAYNVGKSFFQLEVSGAGTVCEFNKIIGFGWNQRTSSWLVDACIWISTSGGAPGPPSKQGNTVRGNYIQQITRSGSARYRSGLLDIDQSQKRNFMKEAAYGGLGPFGTERYGRIPDAHGSARPGIRQWKSAYNHFYGNTVKGVRQNGVKAGYPSSARPDLTDKWYCNNLDGELALVKG